MSAIRYTARKLRRSPLFTLVTLVTLAAGIGATTAIFTVVNSVLLEPLPFEEPDRLVGLWHTAPGLGFDEVNMSPANYFTYREQGRVFEEVGMWDQGSASVTGVGEPEQVDVMRVTDGTLPLLRVQPEIGRSFTKEEDAPGSTETVLLAHGYWQRRFGGSPDVIGQTIMVDGRPRQIIGVMRPGFRFLRWDPALYLPFRFDRAQVFMGNFSFQGVARLKAGATIEQANADVSRMIPLAVETFSRPGAGITMSMLEQAKFAPLVRPLERDVIGDIGRVLWVLLGTVAIVLLIAVANVANLFLVRAEGRQQEFAVRTALGADRRRVAAEFLTESVALGLVGGVLGLLLALAGVRLLVAIGPESLPRLHEIGIGGRAFAFAVGISLLAGLSFGLFPVVRYGRSNLVASLKEGGRGGSAGRDRHRARNALVVAQMALALVLLVGSGLMIRSFQALRRVDPGFDRPDEVLTLRLSIPNAVAENAEAIVAVHQRISERIAAIPGVESVGMSSSITMDGNDSNDALFVEEFPTPEGQLPPIRRYKFIAPGYFETLGNRVVAGRAITWSDIHSRALVVVVTENFAREYWNDSAAALGKRVRNDGDGPWREIIGVVADAHDDGLSEAAPSIIYWPMLLENFWAADLFAQRSMGYAIRSGRVGSASLLDAVRQAVWSENASLPLANVRTLREFLDRSMARTSFTLIMLGIAAGVALLLGAVGIYGVISYVVSQRTREIGVRVALGARAGDVSGLVLRHGLALAATGAVIGLVAAAALTRLMSSLLFGVRAVDPVTFAGVAVLLVAIALLACWLPARRAMRIDPIEALRWE